LAPLLWGESGRWLGRVSNRNRSWGRSAGEKLGRRRRPFQRRLALESAFLGLAFFFSAVVAAAGGVGSALGSRSSVRYDRMPRTRFWEKRPREAKWPRGEVGKMAKRRRLFTRGLEKVLASTVFPLSGADSYSATLGGRPKLQLGPGGGKGKQGRGGKGNSNQWPVKFSTRGDQIRPQGPVRRISPQASVILQDFGKKSCRGPAPWEAPRPFDSPTRLGGFWKGKRERKRDFAQDFPWELAVPWRGRPFGVRV